MVSRDKFEKILLFSVLFVISTTVLTSFPVAFADNVQAVDPVTKVLITTASKHLPGTIDVRYFITPSSNSGDVDPGNCNIPTGTQNFVDINIGITPLGAVTVSQNPVRIFFCKDLEGGVTVTFSSTQGGVYNISATISDPDVDPSAYNMHTSFILEFIGDTTPPVITSAITGTLGNNGWYTDDVLVDWTVTENESPLSLVKDGCDDTTVSEDTTGVTFTCNASSDGGTADPVSVTIKRDATAPSVTGTPDGSANLAGWYKALVTVTWTGEDATSDVESCSAPSDYSGPDSDAASVSGICTDNAGNVGNGTFDLDYDATPPTVTRPPNVTFAAECTTGFASVAYLPAGFSDDLSGLDTTSSTPVSSGTGVLAGNVNIDTALISFNANELHTDTTANGFFDVGEAIYRDNDSSGTVSKDDYRFANSLPSCTGVKDDDADIGTALISFNAKDLHKDSKVNGSFDVGEAIYRDNDSSGTVSIGDYLSTSLPVGRTTITHTATDKAGNTTPDTSTVNVFDVIGLSGIVYQGTDVNITIKDRAQVTTDDGTEKVTFYARSKDGDDLAKAGIPVDAKAKLPGTEPLSFTFENAPAIPPDVPPSLVVTSESTDQFAGKLNLGSGGSDRITVKYTSTNGVYKEISAETQLAGGGGRPATLSDPFRWNSDRYLIETTGTLKAFESTLSALKDNTNAADTLTAQVATSGPDAGSELSGFTGAGLTSFVNGQVTITQNGNSVTATFTNVTPAGLNASSELTAFKTYTYIDSFVSGQPVTITQGAYSGTATFTEATYSITLYEDAGNTGTFTSPPITFSSSLASSISGISGGINRLYAPATATVTANYDPLDVGNPVVVTPVITAKATIDNLPITITTEGAITVTTTGFDCSSLGGDTDNDGICNNWEDQSFSPGLFINQFTSAPYSLACKPQIDDTAGNFSSELTAFAGGPRSFVSGQPVTITQGANVVNAIFTDAQNPPNGLTAGSELGTFTGATGSFVNGAVTIKQGATVVATATFTNVSPAGLNAGSELTAFAGGPSSIVNGAVTITRGANVGTATFTNSGVAGLDASSELGTFAGATRSFVTGAVTITQGAKVVTATFTDSGLGGLDTGRYSIHDSSTSFATTDTTSYGCPTINQRDVFIEWDYMNGHKPYRDAISKVIDLLATAPDPDGGGPIQPGIKVHFQLDDSYGFHRDQITFNKTPATLTENYNIGPGGWTQVPVTGIAVIVDNASTADNVQFNAALDGGTDRRVWKSLGITLDNVQWKMESKFNPTLATTPNHFIYVLQAGTNNPDLGTNTQDRIGVAYKSTTVNSVTANRLILFQADTTATETFGTGIAAPIGSTNYITVERTSATNVKLSVFSDANRVIHVAGSPVNLTIPPTIIGLNTLQHSVASTGVATASLTATIDDTNIYNGYNPGFQDLKLVYFGKSTERVQSGKTANFISDYLSNKRQVFHYGASLHELTGRPCTSGLAEVGGNDLTTTLGCFTNNVGSVDEQAGTILHEIGHNFNLNHGGGSTDENIGKPNYLSVMNYAFQFTYPVSDPVSDGSYTRPLDFSRSALPSLDERSIADGGTGLSEALGIGPAPQSPVVTVGSPGSTLNTNYTPWKSIYGPGTPILAYPTATLSSVSNNPINWNGVAPTGEVLYGIPIHNMPLIGASDATPRLLEGYNDYAGIDFNFRDSSFFSDGFSGFVDEAGLVKATFTSDVPHDTPFVKEITAPIDAFSKTVSPPVAVAGLLEDPDGSSETYNASWNWGDSPTPTSGTVSAPFTPASGGATKDAIVGEDTHTYSQGRYLLSLTVADTDSPPHSSTTPFPAYLMVSDSSTRNRISSSSTFDSPAYAVRSPTGDNDVPIGTDPTVGPVTTTFSAQYKSGVISGSFGFNLKATNGNTLELKNSKLDWVVITKPTPDVLPPTATGTLEAHAKGTANITGRTGTFGFVVSVVDKNPSGGSGIDTIRIRIWDPTRGNEYNANAIIYDNMCLDPDGSITGTVSCSQLYSSATTPITSGTVSVLL